MLFRIMITGVLLLQSWGLGQLQNPDFEEGVSEPNSFTRPAGWITENYAALHSSFTPILWDGHQYPDEVTWSISGPAKGDSFLVLSTGDTEGLGSDPTGISSATARSGDFLLSGGNSLHLFYFFGTCDWYSDYASIKLIPTDPNNYPNATQVIDLLACEIVDTDRGNVTAPDIPKFGSSGSWEQISYTVQPGQDGLYAIECHVSDSGDAAYKSYLAVDGIRYCKSSRNFGDVDLNCKVDLTDFTLFASAWMTVCHEDPNSPYYDPNSVCDPNIPTHKSDFDGNDVIDTEDLGILSEHWLDNFWVN
jgi:hypothetical protein